MPHQTHQKPVINQPKKKRKNTCKKHCSICGKAIHSKSKYEYCQNCFNLNRQLIYKNKRVGETNLANNNQRMTIIDYQGYNNITVQFEDGTIVYNKTYGQFKDGMISNPNFVYYNQTSINEYILSFYLKKYGFEKAPKGSLKQLGFGRMELDCYNPKNRIAIEYDGYWHNRHDNIDSKKNSACLNNNITLIRIRAGKCQKIIKETGIYQFMLTNDKPLSHDYELLLKKIINNILNKVLEKPISEFEIDFQRDRELILASFANAIGDTSIKRLGETNIAANGMKMTIIRYARNNDVDIQFEDGTIVKNKRYDYFKKGTIANPNCPKIFNQQIREQRVGETATTKNGQKITIIVYRSATDIDVQFEDGSFATHRTYQSFKNGRIRPDNASS